MATIRWKTPTGNIRVKRDAAETFSPKPKLQRLIAALGSDGAARVLGIDRSRLSLFAHGSECITAEAARRISDVEYLLERAVQTMTADAIGPWLTAPEPLLGDRVPLSVLAREGPMPVVNVLEALYAGVLI